MTSLSENSINTQFTKILWKGSYSHFKGGEPDVQRYTQDHKIDKYVSCADGIEISASDSKFCASLSTYHNLFIHVADICGTPRMY